ncbi:MAG: hypothetical protein ACRDZ9_04280 [Acidimicrobiales bacterium]
MTTEAPTGAVEGGPAPRIFWPLFVAGWAVMVFGGVGLATNRIDIPIDAFARWTVGLAVAHDLLLAPLVIGVASLVLARVPPPHRAVLQGALIVTGLVVAFAWPLVGRYGIRPDDPSTQPRDYASGLAAVLAVVWLAAAALSVRVGRRRGGQEGGIRATPTPVLEEGGGPR